MKVYDLPEEERIKQKKEFDFVYSSGKIIYSNTKKLKAIYCFLKDENNPGVKVAFAISKKAGNAVWRNRVKRLMRESYRLNKLDLVAESKNNNKKLLIVFSLHSIKKKNYLKVYLKDILPEISGILLKLKASIL
ncbi:MAG TPA: ribonuclease P protein component [Melioribacteraceae bacterium]|nr:ribonuclease P protein component [Melioribacteraceae bacterium]